PDRDALARCARAHPAHHPVARGKSPHTGTDALDHAGEFRGGRERERGLVLVFAGGQQRGEEIERGGLDGDDHPRGPRNRRRDVLDFEVVGAAEAAAQNGFHGVLGFGKGQVSYHVGGTGRGAAARILLPLQCPLRPLIAETGSPRGAGRGVGDMQQMMVRMTLAVAAAVLASLPAAAQSPAKKGAAPKEAPSKQAAPAPGGGHPSLLGQYGDWGAYAAASGGGKVCYALATPSSTRTNP